MHISTGKVLYGRYLSQAIYQRITSEVSFLQSHFGVFPKLVVIEVGFLQDSALYIEQKRKFASKCGIDIHHMRFPSHSNENKILDFVHRVNSDPLVHGIMLQLPIISDRDIDPTHILNAISSLKDVEGLNSENTALLSRGNILCERCGDLKQHVHIPCTAAACYALIKHVGFPLVGSHCLVIGRGRLVGAPTADLLGGPGCATVTQCHIHSKNLDEEVKRADVIVAAAGCHELVKGEWIKPGALVLDCGYNMTLNKKNHSKPFCVGDVEFATACKQAGWITPVPGGVGPVSIAMLFRNLLNSANWSVGLNVSLCSCEVQTGMSSDDLNENMHL